MKQQVAHGSEPALGLVFLLVLSVGLGGCGGGGGGGGGGEGDNVFISLEIADIQTPLANQAGATTPAVIGGVKLNSPLTFTFGGVVDPASLPACGAATGSINITTQTAQGTVAAQGSWEIDAVDPRILRFFPLQPSSPGAGCIAGFLPSASAQSQQVYTVFIPRAAPPGTGGNPQVLNVGGAPIATDILIFFATVTCQSANPGPSFADPIPGPPQVVSTSPISTDFDVTCATIGTVSPPTTSPTNLLTVVVTLNEPVRPDTVNLSTFRLLNVSANCATPPQIPGAVTFLQGGSCAGATGAQLTYQTTVQLAASTIFKIDLSSSIVDFGGNPVDTTGFRLFRTAVGGSIVTAQLAETFDSVTNRDTVTGVANWDGTGTAYATFPIEVVGTGADGPFSPASSMTINTNAALGIFNYTSISVPNGVTLTISGAYPAQFRAQGITGQQNAVQINGLLISNGGVGAAGQANAGELTPPAGGTGGAGAGRGGNASPLQTQSDFGETGFGAAIDGQPNSNNPPNTFFGGGGGGGIQTSTNQGGAGGGGGSARFQGGNGQAITPPVGGTIAIAGQGGPLPAAMQPPATVMAAGSGGGAGGDRDDGPVGNVALDDTGGAGGGGGGGIRISSVGDVTFGTGATIQVNGGGGGAASVFAGGGAGGSGGMIFVQSFANVNIQAGNFLAVAGSGNLSGADGGNGGGGLLQFEDMDGVIATGSGIFNPPSPFVQVFPFSVAINGVATSKFFDTGTGNPNFDTPTQTFVNGDNGTVSIVYRGAFEAVSGGSPDPSTIFPPVGQPGLTAAQIDQIDGYRYIRFEITLSFPPPPASSLSTALPFVNDITIPYSYQQ